MSDNERAYALAGGVEDGDCTLGVVSGDCTLGVPSGDCILGVASGDCILGGVASGDCTLGGVVSGDCALGGVPSGDRPFGGGSRPVDTGGGDRTSAPLALSDTGTAGTAGTVETGTPACPPIRRARVGRLSLGSRACRELVERESVVAVKFTGEREESIGTGSWDTAGGEYVGTV
jgi:hypothetical protein